MDKSGHIGKETYAMQIRDLGRDIGRFGMLVMLRVGTHSDRLLMVFVPVFSKEIVPWRWANVHARVSQVGIEDILKQ